MATDKKLMNDLYKTYNLSSDDIFTHSKWHYKIITRSWIEKIQAEAGIEINYDVVWCARDFCIIKATWKLWNKTVNTIASAVQWWKEQKEVYWKLKRIDMWSTDSWYLAEIAEKRAMSRVVLKLLWLYAEWYFWEDEDLWDQEDKLVCNIESELKAQIDTIETVEELRVFAKANQWLGKEVDDYFISRAELLKWKSTK